MSRGHPDSPLTDTLCPCAPLCRSFLRLRAAADGGTPKPANAGIVGWPGFGSTPPHWLFLASQLVHKAQAETCDGRPCRLEVWVLQRRGANLADTQGLLAARTAKDPKVALNYYMGEPAIDRKSVVSGKSVSVRVDLGGRRIMKKKYRL